MNLDKVADLIRQLLIEIGEDPNREAGLVEPEDALPKVTMADLPQPLTKALAIYKKGGTEGFINALVSGGPLEGNREIQMQVLVLEKMEKYYGAYQSFQVLHVNRLSDTTRLIYFLMNFQKGPVFGKLTAYRNGDRETVTSFRFHTKADEIFPESLLVGH